MKDKTYLTDTPIITRPAFPIPDNALADGLTKREWFAGLVMQGFTAHAPNGMSLSVIAETAVTIADALIEALDK